jgi:hypothetical protein
MRQIAMLAPEPQLAIASGNRKHSIALHNGPPYATRASLHTARARTSAHCRTADSSIAMVG